LKHAVVRCLSSAKKQNRDQDAKDLAHLLLDQAYILDGEVPSDPAAFAKRLNVFLVRSPST